MSQTHVGFSRPRRFKLLSWLIMRITGAKMSHVWFLYHDGDFDMPMVMDAHITGFRLIPFDVFRRQNEVVAIIAPKQSIDDGLKWASLKLGEAYDVGGLVGMTFVLLGRWLKRKWKNPLNSGGLFCSEIATMVLLEAKFPDAVELGEPSTVDPSDIYEFLKKTQPEVITA